MKKLVAWLKGQRHNERGEEVLDPTPMEVPLKFQRPETLEEKMQRMIRVEMSMAAVESGMESFEEADDFDVEDEPEVTSRHELTMAQEEFILPDASNLDVKTEVKDGRGKDDAGAGSVGRVGGEGEEHGGPGPEAPRADRGEARRGAASEQATGK